MAESFVIKPFLDADKTYLYEDNLIDTMIDVQDKENIPATTLAQRGENRLVAYRSDILNPSLIISTNKKKKEYFFSWEEMIEILREIGRNHNINDPILYMYYS